MRNRILYYNFAMMMLSLLFIISVIAFSYTFTQQLSISASLNRLTIQTNYIDNLQNGVFKFYQKKDIEYRKVLQDSKLKYQKELGLHSQANFLFFHFPINEKLFNSENMQDFQDIQGNISDIEATTFQIIDNYKILGLNHNEGLYGSLRTQAHLLEDQFRLNTKKELQIILLTLRRHEKDFMLRGLHKYVLKFSHKSKVLMDYLKDEKFSQSIQKKALSYQDLFFQFVYYYDKIGLGEKIGLTQEFSRHIDMFQSLSNKLRIDITQIQSSQQRETVLLSGIIVVLVFLMLGAFLLNRNEMKAAQERNPLTGLNGNNRIKEQLMRIAHDSSRNTIIYLDFDYFKPFNDNFGFNTGDAVIQHFSQLLKLRFNKPRYFIGHIGGDDFVLILKKVGFEETLEMIKSLQVEFETYAHQFYSESEVFQGTKLSKDRFGIQRSLPLLGVSASILVLEMNHPKVGHEEVVQVISSMKSVSKSLKIASASLLPR